MLEQSIRPTNGARTGTSVESAQSIEVGPKKLATTASGAGKDLEELALLHVCGSARDSVGGGIDIAVYMCVVGPESLVRSAASAVDSEAYAL
jgi:hypothetical protein